MEDSAVIIILRQDACLYCRP